MSRLANVVNVFAIRQVKQGTETTEYLIGFTLHSFQSGMDPAEKFWGGEVAQSAAKGAMAGVRGRSPENFWGFSRAIDVDGCFHQTETFKHELTPWTLDRTIIRYDR